MKLKEERMHLFKLSMGSKQSLSYILQINWVSYTNKYSLLKKFRSILYFIEHYFFWVEVSYQQICKKKHIEFQSNEMEKIIRTSVGMGDAWPIRRSCQVALTTHPSSWIFQKRNSLLSSPFHFEMNQISWSGAYTILKSWHNLD